MSTTHRIGAVTVTVSSRGIGNGLWVEVMGSGTFMSDAAECRALGQLLGHLAQRMEAADAEDLGLCCGCGHGPAFHETLDGRCRGCSCVRWRVEPVTNDRI